MGHRPLFPFFPSIGVPADNRASACRCSGPLRGSPRVTRRESEGRHHLPGLRSSSLVTSNEVEVLSDDFTPQYARHAKSPRSPPSSGSAGATIPGAMKNASRLPAAVRHASERFAREARRRFEDRRVEVTLFGSHARGEAGEGSDVDLAVVLDRLDWSTQKELLNLAADLQLETEVPLSATPIDRAIFEKWLRQERALALHVAREGVPL